MDSGPPARRDQIRTVPSASPVAICLPSGEKEAAETQEAHMPYIVLRCDPSRNRRCRPVSTSQISGLRSSGATRSNRLSGEKQNPSEEENFALKPQWPIHA